MSRTKLHAEAFRWLAQSRDDLQAAEALLAAAKHPQACFYAHQAAEKAVKALGHLWELDPWGHSIWNLVQEFPDGERQQFIAHRDDLLALDKLYIPTRYPDSLGELTPAEAYTRAEADQAISRARRLVELAAERSAS